MNCEFCNSPAHVWFDCPKKEGDWKPERLRTKSTGRKNARVMVPKTCEICGSAFEVVPYEAKIGKGRTCSMSCAAKLASRPDQSGQNNPNWQGGRPKTAALKRYAERFPEKKVAHVAVARAISARILTRQPCQVCGNPHTHAHHPDYQKPLEVTWLCYKHHLEAHGGRFGGTQAPTVDTKPKFDRVAYQREYMRKWRAAKKAESEALK